jgi:uncharacterized protein YndB with AHSA1/START domain
MRKVNATENKETGGGMAELVLTKVPVAKTAMLIRRPVAEVFEAFVDPDVTAKFWFTRGSGRLEAGKQVRWEWGMYDISVPVTVKELVPKERIVIEWPGQKGPTTVEWTFAALEDGTFVSITNHGFSGNGDEVASEAADSGQGFTWMLAGLKAWLEHGIRFNLVADRFPAGIENG